MKSLPPSNVPPGDGVRYGFRWWMPIMILAAGFLAYHNSFRGPFIFDGYVMIQMNEAIKNYWNLTGLIDGCSRPLTFITFAANYALGGTDVFGFHVTNLVIHLLAALALFGFIHRTLLSPRCPLSNDPLSGYVAFLSTVIWVVHPLQTQSVTYIYERAESLMGFFYLLMFYTAVRGMGSVTRKNLWYSLACICCALGMTAKPIMVTAPLMVLVYDRIFWSKSFQDVRNKRGAFYLGLAMTWIILIFIASRPTESTGSIGQAVSNPWNYAALQPRAITRYLKLSLWPDHLVFDYGVPMARHGFGLVYPWIVVLGLLALTSWLLWRKPALGFLGFWFFLTLAPSSSFFPIADFMVEHRMYLALAAVALAFVLAAKKLAEHLGPVRIQKIILLASLLLPITFLGMRTISQNNIYRDRFVLWRDVASKRPSNAHAYYRLGLALIEQEKIDEAIKYNLKALAMGKKMGWIRARQSEANIYANLGTLYSYKGKGSEGRTISFYKKSLRLRPDFAPVQNSLATALISQGSLEKAADLIEDSLKSHPKYAPLYFQKGLLKQIQGLSDESIKLYFKSIALDPRYVKSYKNLSIALMDRGDFDQAMEILNQAILLFPTDESFPAQLELAAKANTGRKRGQVSS